MKILYVATISNTINRFLIPHIELLLDHGHQVDIACNIDSEISNRLTKQGCKVINIGFQRSPLSKQNYSAYKHLKMLIQEEKYNIVHTHTPIASACTRLACKKLQDVKVIYTAHGFHFFKGAPLKNWLIYYPIERILARYTDLLITINKEDYDRAEKFLSVGKVEYLPGVGIDTQRFNEVVVDKLSKRKELGVPKDAVLLLSVGELNKNKNHQTIIRAIGMLNNPDIYYVICGAGKLKDDLIELSQYLGIEERVKIIGYREDIDEILKVADIFAFPSFREGLSVALMEAITCGLPVICSNIRGNNDLIKSGEGGVLVKPDDVKGFANSIDRVLLDTGKRMSLSNKEKTKIIDVNNILKRMQEIYSNF
ncbi:glycosyltransferase family 4 protein [Bacillus sp. es.036]|uniref:glycosyltransferase family 4 protein n=1 Tax=Bacillus sp. es.036 TaxID=1761764 RepID=UPI000BF9FF7F|nr:glycosyltransferase family 4 protein [Bacillus sp. es.036]PFG15093.1 glycosyltransferase involved in cell wall biosynthesis [Bacillus sp. es.036]